MTPESKRVLWFFSRAAALLVPMIAVPAVTLALLNWGHTASLNDPNPAIRAAAVRATGERGHVDLLMQALQDNDADVRLLAAMYLARREEEARWSANELVALLKDKHKGVRREAISALRAIGAPAAPALVKALSDPDARVREGALDSLGTRRLRSPEERASAISALQRLSRDDDPYVRQKARELLQYLRRQPKDEG